MRNQELYKPLGVASVKRRTTRPPLQKIQTPIWRSATSDEENGTAVAPFALRDKGPKQQGLASLQPSDGLYDKLLSYQYYRLKRVIQTRNSSSTTRLISLIKNLELWLHIRLQSDPLGLSLIHLSEPRRSHDISYALFR